MKKVCYTQEPMFRTSSYSSCGMSMRDCKEKRSGKEKEKIPSPYSYSPSHVRGNMSDILRIGLCMGKYF